ncbi:MAG: Trm112 family protein [Parvularculaceae bacterium]
MSQEGAPAEPEPAAARSHDLDPRLLELLVCPLTKGPLVYRREAGELLSKKARLAYPIRDGVPIMLSDEARALSDEEVNGLA